MLDFPNAPTVGQIFTSGSASWQWDGTKWVSLGGSAAYVLKSGDTMSGLLTLSGAPTANLHAATKLYVDSGFLPIIGNRARASVAGGAVTNPTNTTTTGVMGGLGVAGPNAFVVTPRVSGILDVSIQGNQSNATAGQTTILSMRYGTSPAPAYGAAPVGTAIGSSMVSTQAPSGAQVQFPFNINVVVALTLNTQYWFDLLIANGASSGSAYIFNTYFKAVEL